MFGTEDGNTPFSISPALCTAVASVAERDANLNILAAVSREDSEALGIIEALQNKYDGVVCTLVTLPQAQAHDGVYAYVLKLMTNAVSTFAQAKGRVCPTNTMILYLSMLMEC